jgi:hypothetical protein
MPPQPLWTTRYDLKKRICRIIRNLHARVIRFLTSGPLPHRIQRVRHGKPYVFIQEAYPRRHLLVFGEQSRSARVRYVAFPRLAEDVVRHGMAEEALQVGEIDGDALGKLFVRDFLVDFDGRGDFPLVDEEEG